MIKILNDLTDGQMEQINGEIFMNTLNRICVCRSCKSLVAFSDDDIIRNITFPHILCTCGNIIQLHSEYYRKSQDTCIILNDTKYLHILEYINFDQAFKLGDIMKWCSENPVSSVATKLMQFIYNNKLNDYNEKFKITRTPYLPHANIINEEYKNDYNKYGGYTLVKSNSNEFNIY